MEKLLNFKIDGNTFQLSCPDCEKEVYFASSSELFSPALEGTMVRIRKEKSEDHFNFECSERKF